jgi:hypothetical protein
MHSPAENEGYGTKDQFSDELERWFDQFPKHHMQILLVGAFSANVGTEYILKPTAGYRLREINNDNGAEVENFVTSKT